jgi:hypothetical protein
MKRQKTAAMALTLALAAGIAGAALMPSPALADGRFYRMHGAGAWHGPERVEGHIAFLKAELKITSAQEAQWQKVATAMRQGAERMKALRDARRAEADKPTTSLERLKAREKFAQTHAESTRAFVAAYEPLYNAMSEEQRKAADALFAPRHQRH